jgi:hypothetical protein
MPTYETRFFLLLVRVDGPGELVACTVVLVAFFPVFLPTGAGPFVSTCCRFLLSLRGPFASSSPRLRSYIFLVSGDSKSRPTYCPSGPMTHRCSLLYPWHLPQVSCLGQWNNLLARLRGLREFSVFIYPLRTGNTHHHCHPMGAHSTETPSADRWLEQNTRSSQPCLWERQRPRLVCDSSSVACH